MLITTGPGEFQNLDASETTIQLSQLIELGGKISQRKRAGSFDVKLSRLDYRARQLDVAADMSQTFIELLLIQRKIELARKLVKVCVQISDSAHKRVRAGKDTPLSVSLAEMALAQAKMREQELTNLNRAYRQQLASYWGGSPLDFTELVGDLDTTVEIPETGTLKKLLKKNPDIIRRTVEIEQHKVQTKLARARAVPDITISAGLKHFQETDDQALIVGMSLPLPLVDRNQGGSAEARHNLNQARLNHKASLINAENKLNQICTELQNAAYRAETLKNQVIKTASEALNSSQTSYQQGKTNYLSLLETEKTWFEYQNEYIEAQGQYHLIKTELERLIGLSLRELNQTIE